MIESTDKLYKDFEAIRSLEIVPTILDVVCEITGMGYAAVARVTTDRWLACSVLDKVNFGLPPGAELKIETTICNEIRDSRQPVIIDNVAEDKLYKNHHTPKMYGLQSYISYPIILKTGEFFGTLCAIDSKPYKVSDPKIKNTFLLFADLISFHLQSIDFMERSTNIVAETERNLFYAKDENTVYKQIADHNVLEHVRKIGMFSSILITKADDNDLEAVKNTAKKINSVSVELNKMMRVISGFSSVSPRHTGFSESDLNFLLESMIDDLALNLEAKKIHIIKDDLPILNMEATHIVEIFSQVLNYVITELSGNTKSTIKIYSTVESRSGKNISLPLSSNLEYNAVYVEAEAINYQKYNPENLFDLFVHSTDDSAPGKYRNGLAKCKKIIHQNGGFIQAKSGEENGLLFSLFFPIQKHEPASFSESEY